MTAGARWLGLLLPLLLATPASAAQESVPRLYAVDGAGKAWPAAEARAAMQRTPPRAHDGKLAHGDPDALRYLLCGAPEALPSTLTIATRAPDDRLLGRLAGVPLAAVPSPAGLTGICGATPPIRVVMDDVDAGHPLVRARSLVGRLGAAVMIQRDDGQDLGSVRVTAPRALGPVERYRAHLRFVLVRLSPGGALPVGGDMAGARVAAAAAVERANQLWGSCGVSFGDPAAVSLVVVDPPPPHMLVLGCDQGLPASGGRVKLRVGGKLVAIDVDKGMTPRQAARRVAASLRREGLQVTISDNPPMAAGAGGTTDLLVRTKDGKLATLAPPKQGGASSDATLGVCFGHVELEDGLQHFGDVDAVVGTIEERTLIKAYDDHDPTTIDVFMVPGFALGGRIGESFIASDGGSLRNVVVVDRAGIRSNQAAFTLAHELGHVLLDDPGHPDDFGVDTPTRLMDADASDPSAFGPRRLLLSECTHALRQSGPTAPVKLLQPWPWSVPQQGSAQQGSVSPTGVRTLGVRLSGSAQQGSGR